MGTYTKIYSIVLSPSSPKPGDTVNVQVQVENISSVVQDLAVTAEYDSTQFTIYPSDQMIVGGAIGAFNGSFTMPSTSKTLSVFSWVMINGAWQLDDQGSVNIVVYAGKIYYIALQYDSAQAAVPVSNIIQGKSAVVHVWGENTMANSQQLGIAWQVSDPSYAVRQSYSTWQLGTTSSGGTHEFIGGSFTLDMVGSWTLSVTLYMNQSNPVVVDSFYGYLCSVIPAPTISNFKITNYAKV